jgi:DNA-binding CsgD family transcriptional regulator
MARRIDYHELRRLRGLGVHNADIAGRLGCSVSSVERAASKMGLPPRQHGPSRTIDVPTLFALWASDMGTDEIALHFKCSVSTLHLLSKRHALPKRRRKEVQLVGDPTPEQIAERARECRERHFAERRGETDGASRNRLCYGRQRKISA